MPMANASAWGMRELVATFFAWKIVLFIVACASPGPGYDTSTDILFNQYHPQASSPFARVVEHVVLKLTRWDGIYFATSSTRSHVYEQEWAFSWALSRTTSALSRALLWPPALSPIVTHAYVAIVISHVSHLLSVIVLYYLVSAVTPGTTLGKRISVQAAVLHIFSPAGIFLSAPYGESSFALFNFLGMLCYAWAVQYRHDGNTISRDAMFTVAAGASFGVASMMRSNGLLSGTIFAWDAITLGLQLPAVFSDTKKQATLLATIFAGLLVAIGFALPQTVAYIEYCTNGNTRPWCEKLPPSIYSWVQSHYWGVGFLKYWTLNNLPLFLLAAPMLAVMMHTGYAGLIGVTNDEIIQQDQKQACVFRHVLPRLALPQLILACMAATSFHVQIINRISSGYPVWYMLLALALQDVPGTTDQRPPTSKPDGSTKVRSGGPTSLSRKHLQWAVRAMVMYGIIQGGLYASFLPPA